MSSDSDGQRFVSFSDRMLQRAGRLELPVAQRMIDQLSAIDIGGPDIPTTDAGRAALACSIVANAVVELEERYVQGASEPHAD